MPDQSPAPEPPAPTPESPPTGSPPLDQRFQNYLTLRQKLNTELAQQAKLLAVPLVTEENLPLLLDSVAQTVSQRSIKFLPKKETLTREDISAAIVTAFEELARKQDWLDNSLSRKKRSELAASVAETIGTEIPQDVLQQSLAEREAYKKEVQGALQDRDEV